MSTESVNTETPSVRLFQVNTHRADRVTRKKIRVIFIVVTVAVVVLISVHHILLQADVGTLRQVQAKLEEQMQSVTTGGTRKLITGIPVAKGNNGLQGERGQKDGTGLTGPPGLPGPSGPPGRSASVLLSNTDSSLASRNLTATLLGKVADLETKMASVLKNVLGMRWKSCGGHFYVTTSGHRSLHFRVPPLESIHGCIWVIVARTEGPLKLHLAQDASLQWNMNFTLRALRQYNSNNCTGEDITPTTGDLTINSQFVFLLFYGQTDREGEGFRLNVRDSGSTNSIKAVNFRREESSFSLRYPFDGSQGYGRQQAVFILGTPSLGMSANVTVTGVKTEGCCDHVFLFWINPTGFNTTTCESRSGTLPPNMEISLVKNMPFLIFFRSDQTVSDEGFQMHATYY